MTSHERAAYLFMKKALSLMLSLLCLHGGRAVAVVVRAPAVTVASASQEERQSAAEEVKKLSASVVQLYQQGKYKEAVPVARRAVEVAESKLGPEDPLTSAALSNLAALYLRTKEFKDAEPLYERLLSIREKSPGPSTPHEAAALETYLCLLARMEGGKMTPDSAKKFQRVFDIYVADSFAASGHQLPLAEGEAAGGKARSKPQPRYPGAALSARLSGSVVVRVQVDEQGRVTGVKALDCAPDALRKAAEDAALGALFEPHTVRGKAVGVSTFIVYRFVIM